MRKSYLSILIVLLIVSFAAGAFAMPILQGERDTSSVVNSWITGEVTDDEGKVRNARADFQYTGSDLHIHLYNLATYTHVSNEVLVGLFLDIEGGVLANPNVTATGPLTISPVYSVDYGNDLDGEWAFRNDLNDLNGGRGDFGIVASSYDPLSFSTVINKDVSYLPEPSPAGADFGIVSGDISALTPAVDSYVENSVFIHFDVYASGPSTFMLNQVHFLYGTDYEGETPIPEPGTIMLLGSGLMGVAAYARKRFKK